MGQVNIAIIAEQKQTQSKFQVSQETQDYIKLLQELEKFNNKLYNVIQKHYGEKRVDNIIDKEFLPSYEGYQERLLHHMNQSVLDKLYSRELKDVV